MACHPARSASLARIFTHTPHPALTPRRCRCGGPRGRSPPPSLRRGRTECGLKEYAGLATVEWLKPAWGRPRSWPPADIAGDMAVSGD